MHHSGTSALSGARVLLADDDNLLRAVYGDALRPLVGELLEARNGADCVALARRAAPDLILLDLHMPGVDGWEALRDLRLHPETADVPVVALSGDGSQSTKRRAMQHGFDAFVEKPYTPASLVAALEAAFAEARAVHGYPAPPASVRPTGMAGVH
jgi:two-component system phosphate regulon response regulator PhoB